MRLELKAHCECEDIIRIGRVVENEVTEVEFDFSQWQEEYGEGIATLLVLRNHDANPYPVVLTIENGKALWTITDADTAVFGRGCFQVKYVAGTKVKMSKIFQFNCGKSLTGEGDAPDPYENWLDTLTDLTAETQTNAQAAQASAESASASAQSASQSAEEAEEIRQSIVDNRSDWAEETKTSLKYIDNRPAVRAGTGINAVVEGQVGPGTGKVSASGWYSHAEGYGSSASGYYAHAENQGEASGRASHAENGSTASGRLSHAEGTSTASGETSHAEGSGTQAKGNGSHAEGGQTEVLTATNYAHVEGYGTKAWQSYQHVQGKFNSMGLPVDGSLVPCHVVGCGTDDTHRSNCHTLDFDGNAWYKGNVRINGTPTRDDHLVTKGWVEEQEYLTEQTQADWTEGDDASPNYIQNKPSIKSGTGEGSIIEGYESNVASGEYAHTEGYQTQATGSDAHAEGYKTVASKPYSHSEGNTTIASGSYSHAEGAHTTSSGTSSHAEGGDTVSSGVSSHAEGRGTVAASNNQHAQGKYNVEDTQNIYAHIVGNGTSDSERSNAHTLDWNGNAWYAGKVTAEGTPTEDNDLVPKSYADKFLNAFPVDTASGSVASFSDGAELPLKELTVNINPVQDLHGYDNPWPAGGGTNLLDESAVVMGDLSPVYGINNGNLIDGARSGFDVQLPVGTYTAKVSEIVTTYTYANVLNADNSLAQAFSLVATSLPGAKTFTIAEGQFLRVFHATSGDLSITGAKLQIEEGSSASDWTPYSNICPISGWTESNVVACGVNVWDEEWELGSLNNTTGAKTNATTSIRSKNYIPVTPNTQYYFPNSDGYVLQYDADKNYIGLLYNRNTTPTATNCRFLLFRLSSNYGTEYKNDYSINYPSTIHTYEPYHGTPITIPFGQTVYGGVLDVLKGKLTVTKFGEDLNTKTWQTRYTGTANKALSASLAYSYPRAKITEMIAENYSITRGVTGVSALANPDDFAVSVYPYDNQSNPSPTTIYAVVDVADSTPTGLLVYDLATPIEITLDPHTLESLYGNNTIYADTGDTGVEYRADPTLYIQKKIAQAISALT